MEQALDRFAQYLKRRFGQSSTLKHYTSDLKIFFRIVGDKAPAVVTPQDIDAFVDHQIALGLRPATINRRLASLHTCFEYLASERSEGDWPNPVIPRRHRLKTGLHLPRDVADRDVAHLFAVITDTRDRAMFGLMVGAGLRVGEVCALRLESVEAPTEPGRLTKLRVCGKGHKERVVWLPPALWETVRAWLQGRPAVESDYLFLNRRGQPLSVAGIQYCLQEYTQAAGVRLSCHRLRHTFARRLAENGLAVDSLAKLLGHSQLQTTQRYIDGADPTVRSDFAVAMAHLENTLPRDPGMPPVPAHPSPPRPPRTAPPAELEKLQQRLTDLPPWLRAGLAAYLQWRWPTWRAQTAYQLGSNLVNVICRVWVWLAAHRQVTGWETFRRADLEAWMQARSQDGVSEVTIRNDLAQVRSLLQFLERRDWPLDPGLFRVQPPQQRHQPLPRYLPEVEYRRLETVVHQATQAETYEACFDRAWFLTLAHTGLRLSELLDLRVEDLTLAADYATVRGSKPGRDRVVYLTPALHQALQGYLKHRPDLPGDDHVFILHGRLPTGRTIQRRLDHYGQQAGLEVSPHRLRHTFATRLINQGMPIHSLRKLLGHQYLNTTQVYASIYDETLHDQFQEAMARWEGLEVSVGLGTETWEPVWAEIETEERAELPVVNEGEYVHRDLVPVGFDNSV
ncbi:MAG: tyrosine-type recombinase/integrase [Chloroflexi bacterium]|nr:tyrosine-type recombinase/integrase [Chloroflexota bacterium]